ncbi:MAG: nicotinate (nicotinamide) nucleotide adenylyltransferase, partial [Anaeroplasmataceae bacterium]|nr:nicotinate (nicotinamide) nucleotide adenylyltransferase [Anaeroplasmataceae bacterium]
MKIGVYGGSFNPCHLMHKQIVLSLLEKNIFDRIIVLPTGNFYNKKNLLKGEERKKMLELMFQNQPRVIICDYEFKNNLICTYRSLDYLQNMYKGDTLYFIMGSDNILSFDKWKRYEYILDTYNLLIIQRKGIDIADTLEKYSNYKGEILLLDLDLLDIQSNQIRTLLYEENYESVISLLDECVLEYIKKKKLYSKWYVEEPLQFESDEDFLKNYSSDDYEKMSITTDIALFSISDIKQENYRKKNTKSFSILLVKRTTPPFMNRYCIPGGFLSLDEKLLDCAKRVLYVEANIENVYLDQIHTFSDIERDIRGRILSVSYLGLLDKNLILPSLKTNASFFDITIEEQENLITIYFKNEKDSFHCKLKRIIDSYG